MSTKSIKLKLLILLAVGALLASACGSDDSSDAAATSSTDAPAADDDSADDEAVETDEEAPETDDEPAGSEPVQVTIGIANIAPVQALLLVEEGFYEGIAECSDLISPEFVSRNAEGDGSAIGPIVSEFLASDVDMILAISTPVLQATVSANEADGRGTPVLFGAVTDPFAAGAAVSSTDKPDWLAGWQADAPVIGMFDIAQEAIPNLAVIGVAYDPSQVNSERALEKMQAEADARGLTIETATIADSSEVGTASAALAGRDIDAFFVPTDSILVNGLAGMVSVADDFNIPMIAQDSNTTSAGAAIGTGLDYRGDGVRNGQMACQILTGEATPADFPIQQFETELVAYNTASALAQELEIPAWVVEAGVDNG